MMNYDDTTQGIKNTKGKWTKDSILLFPKKSDYGIIKNYIGIILTTVDA